MRAHKEDGTMTTFVERLKALREGRHLSQRELAYQAGLSKSLISMLESGAREPRTEHLEGLTEVELCEAEAEEAAKKRSDPRGWSL